MSDAFKNNLAQIGIREEARLFTLDEYIEAIERAFEVGKSEQTEEEKLRYMAHVKEAAVGWSKMLNQD
jgi:hypothetical protein